MTSYRTTKGARALKAYLDRHPVTREQFARELDVGVTYLYQVLQGRHTPSLALGAEIEKRTGIPCVEWTVYV